MNNNSIINNNSVIDNRPSSWDLKNLLQRNTWKGFDRCGTETEFREYKRVLYLHLK